MNQLKELVYTKGLETLLQRMEALCDSRLLKDLSNPVIISAAIVDIHQVTAKIMMTWTCFGIKNVQIDIRNSIIIFEIYGECYIPSKYKGFRVMQWSATKTEECDCLNVITEESAEKMVMPLRDFIGCGIEVTIV